MKTIRLLFIVAFGLVAFIEVHAAETLTRREWKVDGVTREALVHVPPTAKTNAAPIVFAFHGHGGSMRNAARTFGYHTVWPEAIVVYMQGLNTPGRLTDPEGKKPGWQHGLGDQEDRDLKFFDAVLASLEKHYRVDKKRIYSTGHSNGGGFTYLLWAARGERFAAFAPSASVGRVLVETDATLSRELARLQRLAGRSKSVDESSAPKTNSVEKAAEDELKTAAENKSSVVKTPTFVPRPVLHVAGENDPLVKFEWQKLMLNALRKLNQCGEGKPWEKEKRCTIYESKAGAPVVTFIHSGTHKFPENAPAIIVKFFKEHAKP